MHPLPTPPASDYVLTFERALLSLDSVAAAQTLRQFLAQSEPAAGPALLADRVVIPALDRIGQGWEIGQVSLSQVYMSGRLCEQLLEAYQPALLPDGDSGGRPAQPRLAIATLDDYHLLGKRLVLSALRAAGYAVRDYGRQEAAALAGRAAADGVQLLLISVLMLPSALRVREVRARLTALGCPARVVVGGAPFRLDRELWREAGADAVGYSASDAVRLVQTLEEPLHV